jgi:hypothetical protein
MGSRARRARRALEVARVARTRRLLSVLREIGIVGERPATRDRAREFRLALEQLGTTYVKLGGFDRPLHGLADLPHAGRFLTRKASRRRL